MYSLEKGSATVDPFEVMQLFIDSTYYQTHMMDMTLVCRLFGVSRSGYYAWLTRQRDTETKRKKAESEDDLKEKVRQIIRKIGFVPGARTLKVHFWRRFALNVGRKKCGQLLSDMHLVANRPFKDAYKHQATHDHPYASPADNLVNRNFYIGPRKVILTSEQYLRPYLSFIKENMRAYRVIHQQDHLFQTKRPLKAFISRFSPQR